MTMLLSAVLSLGSVLCLGMAACAAEDAPAAPPDPVAEHVAVVQRRIEATNAKDWTTWQALHTPGAIRTAPGLPGPLVGSAAMRAGIEELVATFPDYQLTLIDAFGQGDRLVARIHSRGTMRGPLQLGATTIPPTGRAFEQDWVALLRFDGGRIASIDELYDNYTILLQLGLATAP